MRIVLILFMLIISLTLHAQDTGMVASSKHTGPATIGSASKPFTGIRNTAAAVLFYDNGREIGRLNAGGDFTGKDSTGTVFIKNRSRNWYIVDTTRTLPVLMRLTEIYLNLTPKR